jgi:integral membrane protein
VFRFFLAVKKQNAVCLQSICGYFWPSMQTNSVRLLRRVGFLEGVSLLVLLFIAMPLKYIWHQPGAVKIVGWIHGALFVLFMLLLLRVYEQKAWSFKKVVLGFLAAFLPFGTFVFDRQLKKEE